LTAEITPADVSVAGEALVTVFTPAPGGGLSNAQTFTNSTLDNPTPAIPTLSPASMPAGSPGFTLTVDGAGFVFDSLVQWNGADRATTYVSETQLTVEITPNDVASAGSALVTVFNPAPGGGVSNAQILTIGGGVGGSFFDDFTRPPDALDPLSPWVASMGTWTVFNGVMQGSGSRNQYAYASLGTSPQGSDYAIQATVQLPARSFGGGIGGRLNAATGAHYGAWVYPSGSAGGSNLLKLWKFNSWTDIGEGMPLQQVSLPNVGTTAHTLRLTFSGDRIQVHYDGALMIDTIDENAPYLAGGISIDWFTWSRPYTLTVDDVTVTPQ
jgi:hypothetical protein